MRMLLLKIDYVISSYLCCMHTKNRTASEIARRTVVLDNLKKQVGLLVVSGSPLTSMGSGAPSPMQFNSSFDRPRPSSESKTAEVSMNPINTSDKGLIQRQQDVMKLQDEMVLDIAKGVDRLHDQVRNSLYIWSKILKLSVTTFTTSVYCFRQLLSARRRRFT